MSRGLYEYLMNPELSDTNLALCADTAFPVSSQFSGRIVTPLKEGDISKWPDHLHDVIESYSTSITSLRQAAEWGMGAIEKAWPRFTQPFPFDPSKRGIMLEILFRLYNFRVRRTGINQINTVFQQ